MTLSTLDNRESYSGNGVTVNFAFPNYFLTNADLVVILRTESTGVEVLQVLTTNYTVSGAGNPAGGTVTMLVAPPTGTTLTIYRDVARTQELDLVENDSLPAEPVEKEFDKLTMMVQRLADKIARTAILTEGYSAAFDPTFPSLIVPDTVLAFNSAGDGFATGPTIVDIAAAAANAAAAAASAAAAAASATASSNSAAASAASAVAADASATAAAASAADAAAVVSTLPWNDVVFKTFADSPITLSGSDKGKIISIDCTLGNVLVNLPQISGLTLTTPFVYGIKKTDASANTISIRAYNAGDGTNKIDGANTKAITDQNAGAMLIPDTDPSPDGWTSFDFGAASTSGGSGSGGGSLQWVEDEDAPLAFIEYGQQVYRYEQTQDQNLYTSVKVPAGYVAGRPITMVLPAYVDTGSGSFLLSTQSTLIRPGTDFISTTTNQRTSTNVAVASVSGVPSNITLDLTSTIGEINAVAVSPNDIIKVRLFRNNADSAGADLKALVYLATTAFS